MARVMDPEVKLKKNEKLTDLPLCSWRSFWWQACNPAEGEQKLKLLVGSHGRFPTHTASAWTFAISPEISPALLTSARALPSSLYRSQWQFSSSPTWGTKYKSLNHLTHIFNHITFYSILKKVQLIFLLIPKMEWSYWWKRAVAIDKGSNRQTHSNPRETL